MQFLKSQERYVALRAKALQRSRQWRIRQSYFYYWKHFVDEHARALLVIKNITRKKSKAETRAAISRWKQVTENARRYSGIKLAIVRMKAKRKKLATFLAFSALRKRCWAERRNRRVLRNLKMKKRKIYLKVSLGKWKVKCSRRVR